MQAEIHRGFVVGLLLLFVSGCVAGCGGSGSSSGDMPTGPSPMLLFTPDRAAVGNSVTMRAGANTAATALELEIFATDLVDVRTMDFTVTFPADLLRFDGARAGNFLGAGVSQIVQTGAGAVTLLMTGLGQAGATGSGLVTTLDFRAIAGGNGRLDFLDPEAADAAGLEIQGIDWIGGTVQIVF